MKITSGTIAAIVAVLLLTGCAATPEPAEPAAPATVETTTPATAALEGDTELYLKYVRDLLKDNPEVPGAADLSDEELLTLAAEACRQLESGRERNEVVVFEGDRDVTWPANLAVTAVAARAFCTDYDA